MLELTTTRHNHLIDPGVHVWGWEIPIYLFVGGLVAGMMVITGYLLLTGRFRGRESVARSLPLISLIVLSAGMLALFLDLEHKLYFWRLYTTFEITSPMSWGAWILLLVYPALVAAMLIRPPSILGLWDGIVKLSGRVAADDRSVRWIGTLNVVLGVMLGIYTGILLSAMGSRPLWNSALLGPLFLTSGLSGAAAFVHMIARDRSESDLLVRADNGLLVVELVIIGLFLIGMTSASEAHIRAAGLFLGGSYTSVFWVFVVGAGIIFPLVLQLLMVRHKIRHTVVAPLLVVAGGIALRFIIVYAGQASHM
ncbi:MAG: polysulfide reductase NrfD [Bacteroidetes bacterium]|nr:polysulfide reductase NrfD [Bacteroidota bacterium]